MVVMEISIGLFLMVFFFFNLFNLIWTRFFSSSHYSVLPSFSNQEWFLLENNITENQWKIAEIIYIPFQKVHVWPVLQLPKPLSFLSLILFPTWFVVNDINFWSTKVFQWVSRRHKVLTRGQERLFRKVTTVSIHSFVEWLDTFFYVLRPADVKILKCVTLCHLTI